jgi:hypothetical protein
MFNEQTGRFGKSDRSTGASRGTQDCIDVLGGFIDTTGFVTGMGDG